MLCKFTVSVIVLFIHFVMFLFVISFYFVHFTDTVKEIGVSHPALLKSRIQLDNFRNKSKCEELIKFLDQLHI